tara:strand:- start:675 stop:860 length:186 start_codon:yes stop_codon:yes gene_type:complete
MTIRKFQVNQEKLNEIENKVKKRREIEKLNRIWGVKHDYWLFNEYEYTKKDLEEMDDLRTN